MIGACVLAALLAASTPTVPDPVRDCPRGLVCFSAEEAGEIDVRLIELERDLRIERARGKRFGFTAGCGPGVAARLIDGDATIDGAVVCGVVWGPRF